jgi:hypothetical protein
MEYSDVPVLWFEEFWEWSGENSEIPILEGTLIVTTGLPIGVYPIPNHPEYYASGGYTKARVKKCLDRTEFTWWKERIIFFDDVIY